jgi:hypothetical protein
MAHPIPSPTPVALRSQSKLDRMLLFIALAAVVALTAAVVILTNDNDQATSASKASPAVKQQPQTAPGVRFDGGPDEGTRGPVRLHFKERAGGPSPLVHQGPANR